MDVRDVHHFSLDDVDVEVHAVCVLGDTVMAGVPAGSDGRDEENRLLTFPSKELTDGSTFSAARASFQESTALECKPGRAVHSVVRPSEEDHTEVALWVQVSLVGEETQVVPDMTQWDSLGWVPISQFMQNASAQDQKAVRACFSGVSTMSDFLI